MNQTKGFINVSWDIHLCSDEYFLRNPITLFGLNGLMAEEWKQNPFLKVYERLIIIVKETHVALHSP